MYCLFMYVFLYVLFGCVCMFICTVWMCMCMCCLGVYVCMYCLDVYVCLYVLFGCVSGTRGLAGTMTFLTTSPQGLVQRRAHRAPVLVNKPSVCEFVSKSPSSLISLPCRNIKDDLQRHRLGSFETEDMLWMPETGNMVENMVPIQE